MLPTVDLLVPVKNLARAKTRLVGAAGPSTSHRQLTLALVRDTLAAAGAARSVARLVAVSSDPRVVEALRADGVATLPDQPDAGLNAAVRYGADRTGGDSPAPIVAALLGDLPALRPAELDAALAAAVSTGHRAFCPDRAGTGTTLLVSAREQSLRPGFGPDSAMHHRGDGARELDGRRWPSLQCDVDTAADLDAACALGLGRHTRAVLGAHDLSVSRAAGMRDNREP